MIWAGFFIGLLGGWHCVAMCGPIALMIPGSKGKNRLLSIGLYHSGKILAYLSLGSVFGMVPALINSFKVQALFTISVGIILILVATIPTLLSQLEHTGFKIFSRPFNLKNKLARLLNKQTIEYSFYIGFLNGFVPCGMVYMAALGAMSQTNFLDSTLFMLFFGIGTLPLMSIFIFTAGYFKSIFQKYTSKLQLISLVIIGLFMIWKGSINLHITIEPPLAGSASGICLQQLDTH